MLKKLVKLCFVYIMGSFLLVSPASGGIKASVINDGDPDTSSSGRWSSSHGIDPHGGQSLYSTDIGAEYTFLSQEKGDRKVSLWWSGYKNRCATVPVEIYDGDMLIETVSVDQTTNSGQWNVLGTFSFSAKAAVTIVSESTSCTTSADAVQFSTLSPPPGPITYQPVEWWQDRFDSLWASELSKYEPKSLSDDSWKYYNLAYAINGNLKIYIATGNLKYLNRLLLYVENVITQAKVSNAVNFPNSDFQDGYLGWINHSAPSYGDNGEEYPLFESYMWRYVSHALRIMRQTDAVYNDPSYRTRYKAILSFTETNIWEKWYSRGYETHMYRSRTHMASHWAYIATELAQITDDAAKQTEYITVRDAINSAGMTGIFRGEHMRGQMALNGSAYSWHMDWSDEKPQDLSHGNAPISFFVESNAIGNEWTDTDMQRFTSTLRDVIWQPDDTCTAYVNGSGGVANCWFSDGLVDLGRFDPLLQRRLEGHDLGIGSHFLGPGALNARILSNPGFDGSQVYAGPNIGGR